MIYPKYWDMKWDESQIWCRCQCLRIILTKKKLIFLPLNFRFDRVESDHPYFDEKLFWSWYWRFSWTYLQWTVFLLNPGCLMAHLGQLCIQRRLLYNLHHNLFLDRCYIYLLNRIGLPKPETWQSRTPALMASREPGRSVLFRKNT